MSIKVRFIAGLVAGGITSGVFYAIPAVEGFWLIAGAVAACLVWFGEFLWSELRVLGSWLDDII